MPDVFGLPNFSKLKCTSPLSEDHIPAVSSTKQPSLPNFTKLFGRCIFETCVAGKNLEENTNCTNRHLRSCVSAIEVSSTEHARAFHENTYSQDVDRRKDNVSQSIDAQIIDEESLNARKTTEHISVAERMHTTAIKKRRSWPDLKIRKDTADINKRLDKATVNLGKPDLSDLIPDQNDVPCPLSTGLEITCHFDGLHNNTPVLGKHPPYRDRLWHKCMALKKEEYAYRALERKQLPNQRLLNELAQCFGRKSKLISAICDEICSNIRSKIIYLVDVWAAYTKDSDDIVFVIILKKDVKIGKLDYSYIKRMLGDVSCEGQDVMYSRDFDKSLAEMPAADKEKLTRSINAINVDLMKRHKYLLMISSSPVRSTGYNTNDHVLSKTPCIVFYVLVKGYVPISEDPFESHYNGVPADVREGFFRLFKSTADTYHEQVKNGCQIHRYQLGTLGGFIDYDGFVTCGLTCAHVLLSPLEMRNLNPNAMKTDDDISNEVTVVGATVFQPDSSHKEYALGKVIEAVYEEGGKGKSGIDIAAFQIDNRYPLLGDFPNCQGDSPSDMFYDSGKTADFSSRLRSGVVVKFGATTDKTYGRVVLDINTMSVKTYEKYEVNKEYQITLHNLLEIKSINERTAFADLGDSGALVFCGVENNDLFCLGVVEGGTSLNTCVVMPIEPILKHFNVFALKSFENNRLLQKLDEKFDLKFDSMTHLLETKMQQYLQNAVEILFQKMTEQG